jgi:lactate permease
VFIVDGRRGLRQTWLPAVVCGVTFAVAQYVTSNFISVPLSDVVAALVSAAAIVALVRMWHPAETYTEGGPTPVVAGGAADEPTPEFAGRVANPDARPEVIKAYAPYAIIIAVFGICQIGPVKDFLDKATQKFGWPGLDLVNTKGKELSSVTFNFNILTTPGTQMLIAGVLTMIVLRVAVGPALRAYWMTLVQLRWAIVTVMAVLALAYVMNASGQTVTLGNWMAGAGGFFAFLSPILGWLGVAVTGSDTSSNSLFGALQVTAAGKADLSQVLMAASNSSGGVLGKMISPQNLAIAAAAVGHHGKEGDIFRKVIAWSLVFLLGMCVLAALQASGVLSWMVP